MRQFVFETNIAMYPMMKRKGYKAVKSADYLAWRIGRIQLIASLHVRLSEMVTQVIEPPTMTPEYATQMKPNGDTVRL